MGDNGYTMNRANAAVLSRDFVLAARLYKNILKDDPENTEVLTQLASCYIRAGEDRKALYVCLEILKLEPNNFAVLNNLGGVYRRLGMYHESIAVLERALTCGKNPYAIYYNMGQTYKLMGEYADAEDCFNTVIEENPNDVLAYNHLGSIQALRNEHNKAIQTYSKALQVDPNHPILHFNIASSYEAVGKFTDALQAYENTLRTKPGWIEAMCKYADLLTRMQKHLLAGDILNQALQLDEGNLDIQNALGRLNLNLNQLDKAEKHFNFVLDKKPNNFSALFGLASIYERKNKNNEALEILAKLSSEEQKNIDVQLLEAKILIHTEQMREAAEKINKIRSDNPTNLEALNLLGQFFIYKKEKVRIADCQRKIASIDANYIQHYLDFAEANLNINETEDCRHFVKKYLQHNDKNYYAFKILGKSYEINNSFVKALQNYQTGLELNPNDTELNDAVARLICYDGIEEESLEPINEMEAENLAEEENLELLNESSLDLSTLYNLDDEPLSFEIQEDEIPFDEMPHDEDIPPIDVTAISDEDPIDLPDMEDDVFSSLDPFADRRKQYPPEEEQDYVEIEGDMIPEDIDNEYDEEQILPSTEDDINLQDETSSSENSPRDIYPSENPPKIISTPMEESSSENQNTNPNLSETPIMDEAEIENEETVQNNEKSDEVEIEKDINNEIDTMKINIDIHADESEISLNDKTEETDSISEVAELEEPDETLDISNDDIDELYGDSTHSEINEDWLSHDENNPFTLEDDFCENNIDDLGSYLKMLMSKLDDSGITNFFPEMFETLDTIYLVTSNFDSETKSKILESSDCRRLGFMVERLIGMPGLLATAEALKETGYGATLCNNIDNEVPHSWNNILCHIQQEDVYANLKNMLNNIYGRWEELRQVK